MSDVLAIIPARVGSKGIPNKNFRELNGAAPWQRAFRCCQAIPGIYPIVTSDMGRVDSHWHYAPAPLHTDTCSMVDVVLDVLRAYPGTPDQKVLLVQPTQPLREPKHLEQAIALLDKRASVTSVVEVEPAEKLYYEGFGSVTGEDVELRQAATRTYACDGTVYGFRRGWFMRNQTFRAPTTYMLVVPPEETARLDTSADWVLAELRLRSREPKTSSPYDVEYGYARRDYYKLLGTHRIGDQETDQGPRAENSSARRSARASEHQMPLPYDEGR